MKLFRKVAIVGVGLIGGSMGLAIKRKGLAREVVGVSRHKRTLSLAKKARAIDKGSLDLRIIKDADLVILATPVSAIMELAPKISKIISQGCIVTDVGSTKQEIVRRLTKIFPSYIGSHPLAGSEKHSIFYARADIFKNSLCLLTPVKFTDRLALQKVERLWRDLGCRTQFLSPKAHDKVLSFASHLPHALAFALISSVPAECLKFASRGLKDTTRIAASDATLWRDIFLSNRKNVLRAIGILQQDLSRIKSAIAREDNNLLGRILKRAQEKRESL